MIKKLTEGLNEFFGYVLTFFIVGHILNIGYYMEEGARARKWGTMIAILGCLSVRIFIEGFVGVGANPTGVIATIILTGFVFCLVTWVISVNETRRGPGFYTYPLCLGAYVWTMVELAIYLFRLLTAGQ